MSLKTDNEAAFDAVREVDSGTITLGTGPPAPCLLPSGIEAGGETAAGRHQATVSAEIVAMTKDIDPPIPGERVTLEYDGQTHRLAVEPDSIARVGGGAIFTFRVGK